MAPRASALRPSSGAPAPSDATSSGDRASGASKRRRLPPPAPRVAAVARDPSSACHAGHAAADGLCVAKKALINGVAVEMEVIPAAAPVFHHQGVVARESPVFRDGFEGFSVPRRTRSNLSRSSVEAEKEVEVLAVGSEMMSVDSPSPLGLLRERMASELDALRDLLKKAELISSRGARRSAPVPEQEPAVGRSDELEAGGRAPPSAKRRKVSPPPVEQTRIEAPRMSRDERDRLADRLASLLAEELPGHIVEFLLRHFGCDAHGEMEIDVHSAEDPVLFELKSQLDKLAEERLVLEVDVLPEDEEVDIISGGVSPAEAGEIGSSPCSSSSDSGSESSSGSDSDSESDASSSDSDSDGESVDSPAPAAAAPPAVPPEETDTAPPPPPEVQGTEPGEIQDESDFSAPSPPPAALPEEENASFAPPPAQVVQEKMQSSHTATKLSIAGLLAKAKVRRELLEVERTALPDESIRTRDLRRLCIAEYGRPSVMRRLGLFPKADV